MGAKYVAHVKILEVELESLGVLAFQIHWCQYRASKHGDRKIEHESHGDMIGKYPAYP
jgi:hypothetical protein